MRIRRFHLQSVAARFKRLERKLSKGLSQTSFMLPTFLADVVNLCWLVLALARLAQTSPKIFISL
jgi:hypothetical protein